MLLGINKLSILLKFVCCRFACRLSNFPSAAVRAAELAHHQRLLLPTHFSLTPTACAAVRAVLRTHFVSAAIRAAELAHHQRLLLPTHFQPLPLHPRPPQRSAQFSTPICRPQPSAQPSSLITSGFFSPPISSHSLAPTPSAANRAVLRTHLPSAAVRAAKLAHHQRLLLPTDFQPLRFTCAMRNSPHPFAVRSRPRSQARSSPAASSPHPFPATPLHSRHPQPSTHFSAPIARPQPSAQPSSLITSGFCSPPISSHSVAPTPSAAVRAVLRTHFPSAAVRTAELAHHQRLLKLPTHFQPLRCTHAIRSRPRSSPHPFPVRSRPRSQARSSPAASSPHPFPTLPCTHAVRNRPRASPHPLPVRSRPRSQARTSPAASSPHPFPATPLHPRHPQPSAHFFAPIIALPQPSAQPSSLITSGFFSPPISSHSVAPTPSAAFRAVLRTHLPVRNRPRSQARTSPAASSPHPFPATPLHPRHPQPSAHFFAPIIALPQPSAQPSSLITSGFFSPPISSHSVAPTPSAAFRAVLRTHLPSAAVRAAELAHHQRLLLPTHFSLTPTACAAVRAVLRTHFVSAAIRAAELAHHQRLLLPTHFQPLPLHPRPPQRSAQFSTPICRPQPSAQPSSLITSGFFSPPISSHSLAPTPSAANRAVLRTHLPSAAVRAAKLAHHQRLLLPTDFQPLRFTCAMRNSPHPFAVRSRPRSQARSSPAASSPHPFPATPLHSRHPQPSTHFSAPIARPQPSAQPSSLITSGFCSPPISSHSVAPTPSAAVRAVLRTHFPSAAVRTAELAHHQRLLKLPTHFQPLRCTHAIRSRPRSSPHPFPVRSRPRSQARSSPAASSPHPFPTLPCTHAVRNRPRASPHPLPVRSRPRSQARTSPAASSPHPFPATPLHPRHPQPSAHFFAPIIALPQPSAQPSSLITSGFFSPPISSHSVAPTPSAAFRAVLRTHLPVRNRPRSQARTSPAASSPHPFPATPLHPRHPQPSAHFFAPIIALPQPSAQPSSLITSGFFSPPISSHSVAPTPSAAFRAVLRTHLPSAAVRAAELAHHQRLLLPTHFQPLPWTHAVRSRPRSSPHPLPVCIRPRSQARSSPAASSPHLFPATPLHPRRPHSPHPFPVRGRPRSRARSSPAASSPPHSFPATPLHTRRPQPSAQFSAPICRPQPSAQPSSLITSGFFSPPISSHPLAATPAFRAVLRTHLPSAAVRAAELAHHQRCLLPFPATPLHPRRPQPSAQPSSLITSGFFSPPISSHAVAPAPSAAVRGVLRTHLPSAAVRAAKLAHHQRLLLPTHFNHSLAPTPSAAVRAVLRTHLPSAAVRAAKLAHHQRLLLPTHLQPPPCTHAVRSRPRSSPHPFPVRSRPRSQARSSPAASSPHPFPATPLHPRRPQPSAHFSAPICRPQPSAQPSSLITSGFFSPSISSHAVALAPSATVRALLRTHCPSAAVRAAKLAHHQRLLLRPFPATPLHPRRLQPSAPFLSLPFPSFSFPFPSFPFLSLPFPSFPFLSLPFPSFPFLSLPFPSFSLPFPSFSFLSLPVPSFPFLSLPFPSFPFLSLPFPSFPFLSLPFSFLSLPFPSVPFLSLPFPSCPFLSLPFPSFSFLSFPFPSFPFLSFPFLSLAPTASAHHRSNQLAPPRG